MSDAKTDAIGFGTYRLQGDICTQAVEEAINCGYRVLDTATYYNNFEAIAAAIKGVERGELYLVSKVWHDSLTPEAIRDDITTTLQKLETSYLDLYLVHWPNSCIPIEGTLVAMNELKGKGLIRAIGLSNVTVNHLKRALEVGVPIDAVQVEMHVDFCDEALLAFCQQNGITVQSWRPLNFGKLCRDPMLISIGEQHGKSAAQVALRWIVQKEAVPLPGSTNPKHIAANFDIFDFSLTSDEMEQLNLRASRGERFRLIPEHGLGFEDEFDFTYDQCWP